MSLLQLEEQLLPEKAMKVEDFKKIWSIIKCNGDKYIL